MVRSCACGGGGLVGAIAPQVVRALRFVPLGQPGQGAGLGAEKRPPAVCWR